MSLQQPDVEPEPGWPPRVHESLPFDSCEARSLLARPTKVGSKPGGLTSGEIVGVSRSAKVAPVGVDLETIKTTLSSDDWSQNLKRLNRAAWLVIALGAIALIVLIVLMVRCAPAQAHAHTHAIRRLTRPPAHVARRR